MRRTLLAVAFLLPGAAAAGVWLAGHPPWIQNPIYRGAGYAYLSLLVTGPLCAIAGYYAETRLGQAFTAAAIVPAAWVPGLYLCLAVFLAASDAEQQTWHLVEMFVFIRHVVAIALGIPALLLLYALCRLIPASISRLVHRASENAYDDAEGAEPVD
ncbi:MAG: hypothetical protein V5A84_02640 [Planctomycetota bacterium]